MTNEEAIDVLKSNYPDKCFEDLRSAVDVAIEALRNSPTQMSGTSDLISRRAAIDALMSILDRKNHAEFLYTDEICKALGDLPSAQPEIIHCRDCANWKVQVKDVKGDGLGCCNFHNANFVTGEGYCYWAERRTDG